MVKWLHLCVIIAAEDDIVRKEIEHVLETFGDKGFEARRDSILADEERLRNMDAILGLLTIPWLKEYFGKHYQKYSEKAVSIPATNYARTIHEKQNAPLQKLVRAYTIFCENAPTLFKYTLQDIEL